ncbi:MAG: rRNA adenine N-6-methyltransferase family protein, partial [Methylophilaceae bacterium]
AKDTNLFSNIVRAAFSQRRKTIRNTLKPFLHDDDFTKLNIDTKRRAETFSVAEFVVMTNYLYSLG